MGFDTKNKKHLAIKKEKETIHTRMHSQYPQALPIFLKPNNLIITKMA